MAFYTILCFTRCTTFNILCVYHVLCFTNTHICLPDDPSQDFPLYGHCFHQETYICALYIYKPVRTFTVYTFTWTGALVFTFPSQSAFYVYSSHQSSQVLHFKFIISPVTGPLEFRGVSNNFWLYWIQAHQFYSKIHLGTSVLAHVYCNK